MNKTYQGGNFIIALAGNYLPSTHPFKLRFRVQTPYLILKLHFSYKRFCCCLLMVTEKFKFNCTFTVLMDYTNNPKTGSAPQFAFDSVSKIRHYLNLIELLRAQYSSNKIRREYEPGSRPQGLLIGSPAVAASVMAASQTPEKYSLARESLPYLAENRRNGTGDNLLKVDVARNQLSKDNKGKDDMYKTYQAMAKKYEARLYQSQQKLRQVYRDAVSKISKLSVFYGGKVANAARKIFYNPHKKSGLEGRIKKFSNYFRGNANGYNNYKPKYLTLTVGKYDETPHYGDSSQVDANYTGRGRLLIFPNHQNPNESISVVFQQPQSIDDLLNAA